MRVVQVVTGSSGGASDHAVDVARVLARRGVDAHVVGPPGHAARRARDGGVVWHEVVTGRDLAGTRGIAARIAALAPDVTHLHDPLASWRGRLLAPRLPGGLVCTLHAVPDGLSDLVEGNALVGTRRRRDRLLHLHGERWLARWSGCEVVVSSQAVATYAARHVGLPPGRVHLVRHGVDLDRFHPWGHRPHEAAETALAIWLGLLGEAKRPRLLLDAVGRVPDLLLSMVGDGPMLAPLRRHVHARDLADRVELTGSRVDPAPLLRTADLFVLTSAAENVSLALLQAMASGLPVVATSAGGVPEVVRHGVDGLLVPVDDQDALVAALARLVADPAERRAMGRSARARAEASFGLEGCVDALLEVYERARG